MQDEQAVRGAEDRRFAAMLAGDWDALAALCDPRLIYTHSSGVADTRDSYLEKCRSGYYAYHHIDHPISTILMLDDAALVFGEMNAEITSGGKPKTLRNLTLTVWHRGRDDSEWRMIGFQPTAPPSA